MKEEKSKMKEGQRVTVKATQTVCKFLHGAAGTVSEHTHMDGKSLRYFILFDEPVDHGIPGWPPMGVCWLTADEVEVVR